MKICFREQELNDLPNILVINFVLDTFSKKERIEEVEPLIETASKAAESMITAKSIERVIEKFNRK